MFCPRCGNQLPDSARFCGACGAQIGHSGIQGAGAPAATSNQMAPASPAPVPPAGAQQPYNAQPPYGTQQGTGYDAPNVATQVNPGAQYGSAQTPPGAQYSIPASSGAATAAAKPRKNYLPLIVAAVALVAILALAAGAIRGCAGGAGASGPEGAVSKAMDALLDLDLQGALDTMPDQYVEQLAASNGYSSADALVAATDEALQQTIDYIEGELASYGMDGIDVRSMLKSMVSYEVGTPMYLGESELADLRQQWDYQIEGFGSSFQEAAWVPVTARLGGNISLFGQEISIGDYLGDGAVETETLLTVKIGGRWYLIDDYAIDFDEIADIL